MFLVLLPLFYAIIVLMTSEEVHIRHRLRLPSNFRVLYIFSLFSFLEAWSHFVQRFHQSTSFLFSSIRFTYSPPFEIYGNERLRSGLAGTKKVKEKND